jgi:DNA-binding NarL/FixJ family response regulator
MLGDLKHQPQPVRVAIVEDMRDTREALAYLINHAPGMVCVAAVATAEQALTQLPGLAPDVILLDIQLAGGMNGMDSLPRLKEKLPETQILMLTVSNEPDTVFRCLMLGAIGYVHKSMPPERLPAAIQEARTGGAPMSPEIARLITEFFQGLAPACLQWQKLSPRERQVLELLARGHLKKEIADQLHICEDTVRSHCRKIYEKLHVHSREHAVAKAVPLGPFQVLMGG